MASSYELSRVLNNYVNNIILDNNIRIQLKQLLHNKLYVTIQNQFKNILKQFYINAFLQEYSEYKSFFNDPHDNIQKIINNFIMRLEKKYLNEYAQKEIQDNIKYPINSKVNNLTFSSQDPYFREAPIVIIREFLNEEKTQYKDHVFIGTHIQHHDDILQEHKELLFKCQDKNGKEIFACAYLYPDNIIYLSSREQNSYASVDEVKNILQQKVSNIKGIFCVDYIEQVKNNQLIYVKDSTRRLARRLL